MPNYGIKITKEGKSITTTEPKDYILNSAYSAVKLITTGSGTLTVPSSSNANVEINHSQSFAPMVMFFCELKPGSGKYFFGGVKLNTGDADAGDVNVDVALQSDPDDFNQFNFNFTYVDSTKFRLFLRNPGGTNRDVNYYYLFFGDTGEA